MQIPIKITDKDGLEEWVMLELQGDLQSRTQSEMQNKFIGDLHFTKEGIPILIIGHHILYGKLQDLDKCYAVMRKTRVDNKKNMNVEVDGLENLPEDIPREKPCVEYTIRAIVKKKLLFKTRPKPIIASMQNTK
ncbi:chromosome transmission fidelity protein 8 homolog [Homarus americanus]|uniref:Chromosome transmission fidelity protein 8-like n=1 Tax=Homarus americanus TaxID=6706 RepID=A0A8J5TPT2_HOMAM|nr:chromosome transmission fidelity protein 8 homolog [Homarus americanus]KAG7176342.1 Chromosome transmission fidelity protein 8-like [Homarus americanus]